VVAIDLKLGLDLQKTQVGFMCERWGFRRGYEQRLQDTICRDLFWRNLRDLKAKPPYLFRYTSMAL
jgi:hypothetical protein